MRAAAIGPHQFDVVVPEHPPPRDVAGAGLPQHRVVGPLARLLALQFVSERGQRQHDLVDRRVERALAVLKVEEHSDTRADDLLQRVPDFELLAAEGATLPT